MRIFLAPLLAFCVISTAHSASSAKTAPAARVPDVPNVIPTNAPPLVESVFFISFLSGDKLTQTVSTNDGEKGPYFFLMAPPEGSKEGVELLDILICLKKVNPFAIPSNQGVYLKNFAGQWHYVRLNIADLSLASTPVVEHRCD